jgi:hypothetical protein
MLKRRTSRSASRARGAGPSAPRAVPLGAVPPVGAGQGTPKPRTSARGRRPRPRICLRKGCGRKYQPRRWNQRYCQDPQCQWEVRRWQAARRQARHRQHAQAKARHARAEKARRQRAKSAPKPIHSRGVTSARGHAAEHFFLRRYATDRAAMSIPRARPVTPPATAAQPAGRPFARSTTGNASGSPAAPWMAGRSAPSSTRPHGGAAPFNQAASPTRHRRDLLPNDGHPKRRRSSIIA